MKLICACLLMTLTVVAGVNSLAADQRALQVSAAHARATVAQQSSAAVYATIDNQSQHADRLLRLESPVAQAVALHTMTMQGNFMKMREVEQLTVAPAQKITMQPGSGYHLMLSGLRRPLKAGEKFLLLMTFEKAGKRELMVQVDTN